jgi:adenylosuccinate synthase
LINIVVGAGFGDEGKGQTVANILDSQAGATNFVVRFNGGHQAGHTVEHNGKRHVFSNFAAGTLHGVKSYWSQFCTFHPTGIRNEHEALVALGEDPELWIDPLCMMTLPHDISHNQDKAEHGTVGVGFGSTIERNEKHFRIHAMDLLNFSVFLTKLSLVEDFYYKNEGTESFIKDCEWLLSQPKIHIARPKELINPIFEGAQGILLDKEFGFFPHVTRSKTTAINAFHILLFFQSFDDVTINYVSRTYHTRHGDGPFTDLSKYLELKDDIEETNKTNKWQGEFKKSILDIQLLKHAINCSEFELGQFKAEKKLCFTCYDHHQEDRFWIQSNKSVLQLANKRVLENIGADILGKIRK